jgi:hypothetical protein
MGRVAEFETEKLVLGVLLSEISLRAALLEGLQGLFGSVDFTGPDLPFTSSHYYDAELGASIVRFFLSFRELVDPQTLPEIKIETNRLELRLGSGSRRRVNLDPGLLSLSRFVLASTKNSAHRIPLRHGIYAEVTLVYERGSFRPLEWTYPDYRSPGYLQVLGRIRGIYKEQRREAARGTGSPA